MKNYQFQGFVLNRHKSTDSDLVVEILSDQYGRKAYIAKGARKPKAKLRAHLEPFVPVQFRAVGSKGMDILVGAQSDSAREWFGASLVQKTAAYLFTECVQKATPPEQTNKALFDLYTKSLAALLIHKDTVLILNAAIMQLLQIEGLEPQLMRPEKANKYYFDLLEGCVVGQSAESTEFISPDVIKLWQVLLQYDQKTIGRVRARQEVLLSSLAILCKYIQYHFNCQLKSLSVFQEAI